MAPSSRSVLGGTLKLMLVAACVFLLLEISARVHLFGLAGLVPAQINSVRALPETGFTRPSAVPDLGFELRPNVSGYFKLVPFRTNSRGLRDREYSLKKPANTFRIAVLGASFALPAGVAIDRAFHSLLEERLSREGAPTRYEFINFSVGMYHPKQLLVMLEQRALDYEPDLILFTTTKLSTPLLMGEPATGSGNGSPPRPAADLPRFRKTYPILRSFLVRLVRERIGLGANPASPDLGIVEGWFIDLLAYRSAGPAGGEGPASAAGRSRHRPVGSAQLERDQLPLIERLAEVGSRTGIPILIVRLEFDAAPRSTAEVEVGDRARALGMYHVDTREAFTGEKARDFWIYELDPHPDWRAHEIFARFVAEFLSSNGLLSR